MSPAETIGYAAATITTVSFIPQAWLSWKTRRTAGLSVGMYATFAVGVSLWLGYCLLYTSPSPRDRTRSRMPSSA